ADHQPEGEPMLAYVRKEANFARRAGCFLETIDTRRLLDGARQQREQQRDAANGDERRMPERGRADERQIDGIDATESRQHGTADEIRKPDAAEAANAVDADRSAALVLAEIVGDQRE